MCECSFVTWTYVLLVVLYLASGSGVESLWIRPHQDAFEYLVSEEWAPRSEAKTACQAHSANLINFENGYTTPHNVPQLLQEWKNQNVNFTCFIGLEKPAGVNTKLLWTISNLELKTQDSRFVDTSVFYLAYDSHQCAYTTQDGAWELQECDSPTKRLYICQRRKFDVTSCADKPCYNEGTCVDLVGSLGDEQRSSGYRCVCRSGLTGPRCNDDIDECQHRDVILQGQTSTCHNNGVCYNVFGGYRCLCQDGFAGERCQVSTTSIQTQHLSLEDLPCCGRELCTSGNFTQIQNCSCSSTKCQHRATTTTPNVPRITEKLTITSMGPRCPKTCFNHGRCAVDPQHGTTCVCVHPFTGSSCETQLSRFDDAELLGISIYPYIVTICVLSLVLLVTMIVALCLYAHIRRHNLMTDSGTCASCCSSFLRRHQATCDQTPVSKTSVSGHFIDNMAYARPCPGEFQTIGLLSHPYTEIDETKVDACARCYAPPLSSPQDLPDSYLTTGLKSYQ